MTVNSWISRAGLARKPDQNSAYASELSDGYTPLVVFGLIRGVRNNAGWHVRIPACAAEAGLIKSCALDETA